MLKKFLLHFFRLLLSKPHHVHAPRTIVYLAWSASIRDLRDKALVWKHKVSPQISSRLSFDRHTKMFTKDQVFFRAHVFAHLCLVYSIPCILVLVSQRRDEKFARLMTAQNQNWLSTYLWKSDRFPSLYVQGAPQTLYDIFYAYIHAIHL